MPETAATYDRLTEMIPEYVCGLIWLVDIALVMAYLNTPSEAIGVSRRVAALLQPFAIPEIAVGFLLVITGVRLPYSVARALNPLAITILNSVRKRWYEDRHDTSISLDHIQSLKDALTRVGIPVPLDDFHLAIMPFLQQISSPVSAVLAARRRTFHEQAYLAFPVSALIGLAVIAIFAEHPFAALLAGAMVTLLVLASTVHRAQMSLMRWEAEVAFAFLAVEAMRSKSAPGPAPDNAMGGVTPRL